RTLDEFARALSRPPRPQLAAPRTRRLAGPPAGDRDAARSARLEAARPRPGGAVAALARPLPRTPPCRGAPVRAHELTREAHLARRDRCAERRPHREHRERPELERDGQPRTGDH